MAGPGGTEVGRVSVRVLPDTSRFAADLRTDLARIETTAKVNIGAELDTSGLVEHAKAAVAEASAAAGNVHVGVDVDRSAVDTATRGLSGLLTAALALGPALIPLGAALVAAFAPLAGIFAAASVGIGGIIAVAVPQLAAIVKAGDDLSKLTPAQAATAKALQSLKAAFSDFQNTLAPDVLPLFTKGFQMLAGLLPTFEPIVKRAAKAFSGLLDQMGAFGSSAAGQSMVKFFSKQVAPAITTLGTVFANVFAGIGGLLVGFAPLIKPVEAALIGATAAFAKFGQTAGTNQGFQNFLAYLQQVGPQVVAFLGAFVSAIAHLVTALAPLGGPILAGLTATLSLFNKIPTPVVGALATALIAVVVGIKAWTIAQAALDVVLNANPIGLIVIAIAALVAALIYAWKNSETFRNVVTGAWNAVKSVVLGAVNAIVGFVRDHWKLLIVLIGGPLAAVVILVTSNWQKIKASTSAVWDAIKAVISAVWGAIKGVVNAGVSAVKTEIKGVEVIVGFVQNAFEAVKSAISNKLDAAVGFVKALPGRMLGSLGNVGSLLYHAGQEIIQGLINGIESMIGKVTGAIGHVAGIIASHLPGSPVKTGPLTVLNNGYAGGQITKMLADGITGQAGAARNAMTSLGFAGVASLAAGASAGHSITINEARGETTPAAVLRGLAMAEALYSL